MPRSSPFAIVVTAAERAVVESWTRKYTSPYYQVIRAKIVLLAADGLMSLARSSVNGASAFMSSDWPVWKMNRVSGVHPVFPPSSRRAG